MMEWLWFAYSIVLLVVLFMIHSKLDYILGQLQAIGRK